MGCGRGIGLCTHGVTIVGGVSVTAGQVRHNSSNVGGVTAGQNTLHQVTQSFEAYL